jgi:hypothetical protein
MRKTVRGASIKVAIATVIRSAVTRPCNNAWPTGWGAARVHPARTRPRQKHRLDARAAILSNDSPLSDGHEAFANYHGCPRSYRLHRKIRAGAKRWVVRLLQSGRDGRQELRVRNIATMLGRRARDWRKLFAQSVPVRARTTSIERVSSAPFSLKGCGLR